MVIVLIRFIIIITTIMIKMIILPEIITIITMLKN